MRILIIFIVVIWHVEWKFCRIHKYFGTVASAVLRNLYGSRFGFRSGCTLNGIPWFEMKNWYVLFCDEFMFVGAFVGGGDVQGLLGSFLLFCKSEMCFRWW